MAGKSRRPDKRAAAFMRNIGLLPGKKHLILRIAGGR